MPDIISKCEYCKCETLSENHECTMLFGEGMPSHAGYAHFMYARTDNGKYVLHCEGDEIFCGETEANYCLHCGEPLTEPEPLTLEQLREMAFCKANLQPVWLVRWTETEGEYMGAQRSEGWAFLIWSRDGDYSFRGPTVEYLLSEKSYGPGLHWCCYTHKPKDPQP